MKFEIHYLYSSLYRHINIIYKNTSLQKRLDIIIVYSIEQLENDWKAFEIIRNVKILSIFIDEILSTTRNRNFCVIFILPFMVVMVNFLRTTWENSLPDDPLLPNKVRSWYRTKQSKMTCHLGGLISVLKKIT